MAAKGWRNNYIFHIVQILCSTQSKDYFLHFGLVLLFNLNGEGSFDFSSCFIQVKLYLLEIHAAFALIVKTAA